MFGEEDAAQQAEQPLPIQALPSIRGTLRNPNRRSVRVIVKETPSLYQRFHRRPCQHRILLAHSLAPRSC
jgi:hypothetical protein